ncbi:MAG: GC-type dockerin domain-anchored protein [Phycisphaerales bacterium JB064]
MQPTRTTLCAAAILALGGSALADQLTVPSAEYPTIGAAISAAVDGDEILLLDGVYEGVDNWDAMVDTEVTIRGASGNAMAVVIQGPDLSGFPVDAHRAFHVLDNVTIADMTLQGLSNSAVLVERGGNATFRNVRFVRNLIPDKPTCDPGFGAAAVIDGATAVFEGCLIDRNRAFGPTCLGSGVAYGGAIWALNARVKLLDTTLSRNEALGSFEAYGGAIAFEDSEVRIERCELVSNASGANHVRGGCIDMVGGTLEVIDSRFVTNTGYGFVSFPGSGEGIAMGGAIHHDDGDAMIVNTVFERNRAEGEEWGAFGGAITSDGDLTLVNTIFTGNQAIAPCDGARLNANGGGIFVSGGGARAFHVTSEGNASSCSAGVHVTLGGVLYLGNSIIRDGAPVADPGSTIQATYSNIEGGLTGEGNIDAQPIYQPGSFRLASGSPGVDAGSVDNLIADDLDMDGDGDTGEPLPLDLDGLGRRADDPATPDTGMGPAPLPDMGAYEFGVACPADFDGDGELTIFDFLAFQNAFDAGDPAADFDGDGELTLFDFLAFQNAFDAGCA